MPKDRQQPSYEDLMSAFKQTADLRSLFLANRKLNPARDVEIINSASTTLSEITALMVPLIEGFGMDTSSFLESVAREVKSSREEMDRARRVYPFIDPTFLDLAETAQREVVYAQSDKDFSFVRKEIVRRTRNPKPTDTPQALAVLMKEYNGEYEGDVLHVNEMWPWRRQHLELPRIGPHLVFNESEEDKTQRIEDWLKNTKAQEAFAIELGILEEGERWQNFIRRPDIFLRGPETIRGDDFAETDVTVGYRSGQEAKYGREEEVHFGGLPTYIQTSTKFPGVRSSVSFLADSAWNSKDIDTPLDQLIMTGLATPKITLYIPTNYFLE